MKTLIKRLAGDYSSACVTHYAKFNTSLTSFTKKHANTIMLVFGAVLLLGGMNQLANAQGIAAYSEFDEGSIQGAVGRLFGLIEGSFGALIMVAAGLAAIIAAAMGAYRAAVSLLVVAVGAFILRSLVSLFFGTTYDPEAVTAG